MKIEDRLENLQIVNAGLQTTLTQRNQRIAQLEEQLVEARSVSRGSREYKQAYKKGWQDAVEALRQEAYNSARALGELAKGCWKVFKEGETNG